MWAITIFPVRFQIIDLYAGKTNRHFWYTTDKKTNNKYCYAVVSQTQARTKQHNLVLEKKNTSVCVESITSDLLQINRGYTICHKYLVISVAKQSRAR